LFDYSLKSGFASVIPLAFGNTDLSPPQGAGHLAIWVFRKRKTAVRQFLTGLGSRACRGGINQRCQQVQGQKRKAKDTEEKLEAKSCRTFEFRTVPMF